MIESDVPTVRCQKANSWEKNANASIITVSLLLFSQHHLGWVQASRHLGRLVKIKPPLQFPRMSIATESLLPKGGCGRAQVDAISTGTNMSAVLFFWPMGEALISAGTDRFASFLGCEFRAGFYVRSRSLKQQMVQVAHWWLSRLGEDSCSIYQFWFRYSSLLMHNRAR